MKRETYLGHGKLSLEATPDPVIDTLGFPPCLLNTLVSVGLVAPRTKVSAQPRDILQELDTLERLGALLDDRDLDHGGLRRTASQSMRDHLETQHMAAQVIR